jgi:hypothetical protein
MGSITWKVTNRNLKNFEGSIFLSMVWDREKGRRQRKRETGVEARQAAI